MTRLDVVAVTHRGVVRDHNEDTVAVAGFLCRADEGEPVRILVDTDLPVSCLVADGLGGHAEGSRASLLAAQLLSDAWARSADPDDVRKAVQTANEEIHAEAQLHPQWTAMGTTLVGLVFGRDRVLCVNVGDSRCHRLLDGALVPLSVDDSPALPEGSDADTVTTVVTQTLGGTAGSTRIEPHVYSSATAPGDRFLLSSDGLTDQLSTDRLESVLRGHPDPVLAVRALLAGAIATGAPDNVSAVLVTVLD